MRKASARSEAMSRSLRISHLVSHRFAPRIRFAHPSLSLPEHRDTSVVSFTIALNGGDDFEGGGTWFEDLGDVKGEGKVVDGSVGCCTVFAGPMRHAGYPITKGTRWIAVLFCYVEGFRYGKYLNDNCGEGEGEDEKGKVENGRGGVKPSGDKEGGYVVYRQTVELTNLLEKDEYEEEEGGGEGV